METKIPKLARNKYNYIQGADGNKYMTQSQVYSIGGGGGSGGNSWQNQAMYKVEQMLNERGYATNDDITYMGYITSSYAETYYASIQYVDTETSAVKDACYAYADSKASVDLSSYVTKDELDQILLDANYDTKPDVNTKIANYTTRDIIPVETSTYTLGNSTYEYASIHAQEIYINGVDLKTFIQDVVNGRV